MNQERPFKVLLAPHISEKSTVLAEEKNQVVFKVAKDATKLEIKKAVEQMFEVVVDSVQVLNCKGKVKRNRYGFSRRAGYRKAYVKLAEGHELDLTGLE